MKGKILDSWHNEDRKTTYVKKQTKYGEFEGLVYLDESDADIYNKWDGYRFAEYRCDLQSFRQHIKNLKQQRIGIKHLYSSLKQNFNTDDKCMIYIQNQIKDISKRINKMNEIYREKIDGFIDYTNLVLNERRDFRKKNEKQED